MKEILANKRHEMASILLCQRQEGNNGKNKAVVAGYKIEKGSRTNWKRVVWRCAKG
jgi:hypothetical protein